ncbi:hypothetical protein ACFLT1_03405 [Bacteroidota bacterium]
MRMVRKACIGYLFLLVPFIVYGQEDPVSRLWNDIDSSKLHASEQANTTLGSTSNWHINTSLGTSFTFAPSLGSMMSMYAAPHIEYRTSKRLSFHSGVIVSHAIPLLYNSNPEYPLSNGINNVAGYLSATYRLTDNLYVHGTGASGIAIFPTLKDKKSFTTYNDFSVGATYKIGSFSIGATIHHSTSPYIGLPNGLGHNRFSSPYYW